MKIAVLLKQVPDTSIAIKIKSKLEIDQEGMTYAVNPYDEYALEEAVKLKEKTGGEVTTISIGPQRTETALRTALAIGSDKAVLIESDDNIFSYKKILDAFYNFIKDKNFDIIFTGIKAVDNDAGFVGQALATKLNIPCVYGIKSFEYIQENHSVKAGRDIPRGLQIIEVKLPAVFCAMKGLNTPRLPKLPNIMKAKRMPIEKINIQDLTNNQTKIHLEKYEIPQVIRKKNVVDFLEENITQIVKNLKETEQII